MPTGRRGQGQRITIFGTVGPDLDALSCLQRQSNPFVCWRFVAIPHQAGAVLQLGQLVNPVLVSGDQRFKPSHLAHGSGRLVPCPFSYNMTHRWIKR